MKLWLKVVLNVLLGGLIAFLLPLFLVPSLSYQYSFVAYPKRAVLWMVCIYHCTGVDILTVMLRRLFSVVEDTVVKPSRLLWLWIHLHHYKLECYSMVSEWFVSPCELLAGDAVSQDFLRGMNDSVRTRLFGLTQNAAYPNTTVVVCHSEPGAWYPPLYQTSQCPPQLPPYIEPFLLKYRRFLFFQFRSFQSGSHHE